MKIKKQSRGQDILMYTNSGTSGGGNESPLLPHKVLVVVSQGSQSLLPFFFS